MTEMDNLLRIGEVAKLLGLSPETLRYFEKEGIAKPVKGENNYRYYEDWEINYLLEYRKYRGYGFSQKETRAILHEFTYEDLEQALVDNNERYQRDLAIRERIARKNADYVSHFSQLRKNVNRFTFVEQAAQYYFRFRYNNQYFYDRDNEQLYKEWLSYLPLTEPVLIIEEETAADYYCGLVVDEADQKFLGLPTNHNVAVKPGGRHLYTVICAGVKHTFSPTLIKPALAYLASQGLTMGGPAIGYYRARVQGEKAGEYLRYIEVLIPISDKQ